MPKISIIIPALNQQEMTLECLAAVRAHTQDYEVILVDNGSTPPLVDLDGLPATIRNETNIGFPCAINQGIQAARGDVIILLNNDCIVSRGWAFWLQHHLENYAIVGPVTNYCAGIQRVTLPVYHNEQELHMVAEKWGKEHAGESQEVAWIIGFCMAFKRKLWEEIGPFDESLWPCSGEELDFCLRARSFGYRVGVAGETYIHHHGSMTFKDMAAQVDYANLCRRNEDNITAKWGDNWKKQMIGEARP
jgi:GT2 family glycosyltransferase